MGHARLNKVLRGRATTKVRPSNTILGLWIVVARNCDCDQMGLELKRRKRKLHTVRQTERERERLFFLLLLNCSCYGFFVTISSCTNVCIKYKVACSGEAE